VFRLRRCRLGFGSGFLRRAGGFLSISTTPLSCALRTRSPPRPNPSRLRSRQDRRFCSGTASSGEPARGRPESQIILKCFGMFWNVLESCVFAFYCGKRLRTPDSQRFENISKHSKTFRNYLPLRAAGKKHFAAGKKHSETFQNISRSAGEKRIRSFRSGVSLVPRCPFVLICHFLRC
jgi:hypothetical protein